MKLNTISHEGYTIVQRIDVKSHCATISKGEFTKLVAGDIKDDGTNNAIEKAKDLIDRIYKIPERFAFYDQFTVESMRETYRINAEGLRRMEAKAKITGKKVSGYTLAQLTESAERYEFLSKYYTRE